MFSLATTDLDTDWGHKYLGQLPHMTHSSTDTVMECLKNIYLDGKIQKESISGPIIHNFYEVLF